jgi:hypothetical protein
MTIYKPAGAVAKAFMMDDSFFRGIMGPFGSGKSTVCIMEILRRASLQQPGKDGIRRSRWAVIIRLLQNNCNKSLKISR